MKTSSTTVAADHGGGNDSATPGPARLSFPRLVPANATSIAAEVFDGCKMTPAGPDRARPAGVQLIGVREPQDDQRIALHEIAGHALVCRLLGSNEIGGVTCDPGADFAGLMWGPAHDRNAKFQSQDAASICAIIEPTMPAPGEPRVAAADVYLQVHTRVIEMVAGSVAEAMFLPGEPWPAESDRSQERALASLICSSPESIETFIGFCRAEATALLRPREYIARALTKELLSRRTMTGTQVDEAIAAAVAAKSVEDERQRRAAWHDLTQRAEAFEKDRGRQ